MSNILNYVVVIPAGGIGSRFSATAQANQQNSDDIKPLPKQLRQLSGKTVLEHAVSSFISDEDCQAIVIAALESHHAQIELIFKFESKVSVVLGGASRAESVQAGLNALAEEYTDLDWVMVHDAARPNLRLQDIDNLKECISEHVKVKSDVPFGAILATASQETVKLARLIEHNAIIHKTLDRSMVWQAKTPQAFRLGDLKLALNKVMEFGEAVRNVTDEAAAMERLGAQVHLVEGRNDNIKLTQQTDWHLLEYALKQK